MAFYKLDTELFEAPNFVLNKDYELRVANKDEYSYPVEGWYWFDTIQDARAFFNLPEPTVE
jgi:hypothetical protein